MQCRWVTIRLDEESISYFRSLSEEVGIPYQSPINLHLRDCAVSHRKLHLNWKRVHRQDGRKSGR